MSPTARSLDAAEGNATAYRWLLDEDKIGDPSYWLSNGHIAALFREPSSPFEHNGHLLSDLPVAKGRIEPLDFHAAASITA